MSDTCEDIGTDRRMGMQGLMIGFGKSILCKISHLKAQNHAHHLALDDGRKPLWKDRRLIQWPAKQIFRDDVEAAPHREIGHDGNARSFDGDIHCRVAKAQHQYALIHIGIGILVVMTVDHRAIKMTGESWLGPPWVPV